MVTDDSLARTASALSELAPAPLILAVAAFRRAYWRGYQDALREMQGGSSNA